MRQEQAISESSALIVDLGAARQRHSALLVALAEHASVVPENIALELAASGKPFWRDGPHFSLSKAGNVAMVAICDDCEVGLDLVSLAKRPSVPLDLEFASAEQCASVSDWASDLGSQSHIIWAIKESALKCVGEVMLDPASVRVFHDSGAHFRVAIGEIERLHTVISTLPGGLVAAISAPEFLKVRLV